MDCLMGVIHMLVFPVCRYDDFCKFSERKGKDCLKIVQMHRNM